MTPRTLILPGWQSSGPDHWQSHWERLHGYTRVEQHDWVHPLRGDWITRLESVVQAMPAPLVLVAHSLGCQLVAAWASMSPSTARVRGALLVAPGDTEREDMPGALHSWSRIVRQRLPFASTLVASRDDPFCSYERAAGMAAHWGSTLVDAGPRGHLNASSGLGDWPEGHALLQDLLAATARPDEGGRPAPRSGPPS